MSKTAVIYKSKGGFSQKYAKWLADYLKCDLYDLKDFTKSDIDKYHILIFGSGVYCSKMPIANFINKNAKYFSGKKIIVFAAGLTALDNTEALDYIDNKNFTGDIADRIAIFHLRGGIDYSKLSYIEKKVMKMISKNIKKKPVDQLNETDKIISQSYGGFIDLTQKSYIMPIIEYITEL